MHAMSRFISDPRRQREPPRHNSYSYFFFLCPRSRFFSLFISYCDDIIFIIIFILSIVVLLWICNVYNNIIICTHKAITILIIYYATFCIVPILYWHTHIASLFMFCLGNCYIIHRLEYSIIRIIVHNFWQILFY